MVRIHAMNTYFGSFIDAANQMMFVSLHNNPCLDTKICDIRSAEDFLK